MKPFSILLAALWAIVAVVESSHHEGFHLARHAIGARSIAGTSLVNRAKRKRCQQRPGSKPKSKSTDSKPKDKPKSSPKFIPEANPGAAGLLSVKSSCGNIGATKQITPISGPNGSLRWLNCGVDGGGWSPSYVGLQDLITVDLTTAINKPDSPFKACRPFLQYFYNFGGEFNIPPIILASFAMQESSCNPNTIGGGGEQGLMQLTQEKCKGAPNNNCRDPPFNIRTGAAFFRRTVDESGGNVLLAVGKYNGWPKGMTIASATRAGYGPCCRCQNNLDYLHQFFNGWCQGIDSYKHGLGLYFNLKKCH